MVVVVVVAVVVVVVVVGVGGAVGAAGGVLVVRLVLVRATGVRRPLAVAGQRL